MRSRASAIDRNHNALRHSARTRAFNASMKALSVGFPGREKSISTPVRPLVEHSAGELRPIVDPQALRFAARAHELVENVDHLEGPEVRSRSYRKRLSGVAVHDRQNPERTSVEQLIRHEVHRPDLVRPTRYWPIGAIAPSPFTLWQLGPDDQPFFAIQSINTLLVHSPSLPSQQYVKSAI